MGRGMIKDGAELKWRCFNSCDNSQHIVAQQMQGQDGDAVGALGDHVDQLVHMKEEVLKRIIVHP